MSEPRMPTTLPSPAVPAEADNIRFSRGFSPKPALPPSLRCGGSSKRGRAAARLSRAQCWWLPPMVRADDRINVSLTARAPPWRHCSGGAACATTADMDKEGTDDNRGPNVDQPASPIDRELFRFVAVDAAGAVWEWVYHDMVWVRVLEDSDTDGEVGGTWVPVHRQGQRRLRRSPSRPWPRPCHTWWKGT